MVKIAIFTIASLGGLIGLGMIVVAVLGQKIDRVISKAWNGR